MSSLDFAVDLQRIDPATALQHWEQSEHTTVFTHPAVLARLAPEVHWWMACSRGEVAGLWPVCLDRAGRVRNPELAYFLGPFDPTLPEPSPRRRLLRQLAVQRAFLDRLSRDYGDLPWSTPPPPPDLRPWLWCEDANRKILVKPRYTAVIPGLQGVAPADLLQGFSYERRADARRAARQGARRLADASLASIQALYAENLASQGQAALAERRMEELAALYELTGTAHGFRVVCTQGEQDEARSVWLILAAKGRACGVIAVADPGWRRAQYNAYACWQALMAAQATGADCYDFNGANSPQRGPDKHSYGAEPALYFDLRLVRS
ncbi:MAG: GNAT family N-acetyltransferase [Xanthomonadales bacterium]|jgi:hypothetical protein|nr:GNAT family N-acetyltransferase [Xanthomonadales bacterium]